MSRTSRRPLVSIALPVYNGDATLARVVDSVLAQSYVDVELVICDNASTDRTQELCRHYQRADSRVVYQRHETNIGLTNNFISAAQTSSGSYLRWIGDDDSLEPEYVSHAVEALAEDDRRVMVTTQIVYTDHLGAEILHTDHDPEPFASADPVRRLAEMLRLLTSGFAVIDPLYGLMRRDLAVLPRRQVLREDEVFAARLALAGPWGHVPAPLARRHRPEVQTKHLIDVLGVPKWHRHAMDVLQCHELSEWIARADLESAQRRRARVEVMRMYGRRKRNKALRGVSRLQRAAGGRPVSLSLGEAG